MNRLANLKRRLIFNDAKKLVDNLDNVVAAILTNRWIHVLTKSLVEVDDQSLLVFFRGITLEVTHGYLTDLAFQRIGLWRNWWRKMTFSQLLLHRRHQQSRRLLRCRFAAAAEPQSCAYLFCCDVD